MTTEEMDKFSRDTTTTREAVLEDLHRRWKESGASSGVIPAKDTGRFCHPQKNYFCGSGVMDCPICKTGKLKYSRATYNGHVSGRCSTDGCVAWQE